METTIVTKHRKVLDTVERPAFTPSELAELEAKFDPVYVLDVRGTIILFQRAAKAR